MKKAVGFVVTILVVVAILGGYYFFSQKHKADAQKGEVTEVQKLINKDLEKDKQLIFLRHFHLQANQNN